MFGLGGIAQGLLILLILASLGVVLIVALVLTFVLKACGMPFHKAFAWGFGLPMLIFALTAVYATWFAPDRPEPEEIPIEIPFPVDDSKTQ